MLSVQLFLTCLAVPFIVVASFGFADDEEMDDGASFVQMTVERNWGRGKAKPEPQPAPELDADVEDDISFMQTKVSAPEHRTKPEARHEVHHMMAGVTPDGDVDIVEQGMQSHGDRPPLEFDDAFSLMQTSLELFDEAGTEVSLLQTGLKTTRRDVAPAPTLTASSTWTEAVSAALLTSPVDALAGAGRKAAPVTGVTPSVVDPAAPKGTGIFWLDRAIENVTLKSWEQQQWIYFVVCLLVLQFVIYKASQSNRVKAKDFRLPNLWRSLTETTPKRLSLTLPLRQLLNQRDSSVKLFGSSDGVAYVATLLEDAAGDRTLQLADASMPKQALMSVGPLPRAGLMEDGAAVHRYSTGYTLGALKSSGDGSWSLNKNGHTSLSVASSAPFTLAVSSGHELKEVAWVKPLSEGKEPDYVDLSICETGDPLLPVACALAVLVTTCKGGPSPRASFQDDTCQ